MAELYLLWRDSLVLLETLFLLKKTTIFLANLFHYKTWLYLSPKVRKTIFQKLFMLLWNNWTFWIETICYLDQYWTKFLLSYSLITFFQLENSRLRNNKFFKPELNLNFWSWNGNDYTCNLSFSFWVRNCIGVFGQALFTNQFTWLLCSRYTHSVIHWPPLLLSIKIFYPI